MDGLVGYGSDDSENSSKSPRRKPSEKSRQEVKCVEAADGHAHQKAPTTESKTDNSSAQLEAEWESFQAMISAESTVGDDPTTKRKSGSSSEDDSDDESEKGKKKRTYSSSSSGSSGKSDKSGSESSDDSSDADSVDEKKAKKKNENIKNQLGSKSPESTAKRKSRSPSSSSESETEKKPAPSQSAGQPNGQPHADSVQKERRPSHHRSPKRHRSRSRSRSQEHRRRSRDHRSRSRERKRRRRPRRSRSRGRRSRSRERRMRRRSRSKDKDADDKTDKKGDPSSGSRSGTHEKRRSRSRSPKRRRRSRSGSHSRSRRRRRSHSRSPQRPMRRRRRRRRRRKRRVSGRVSRSRSRSRSRSPSPVRKKRNAPLNYKEKLKQSLLEVQKQAAEGKLNLDELAAKSKDLISSNEKPSNLPLSSDNPLVAMAAGQLGQVTPQQALLQTMAAMHQKAQELTGVAVPKYYNPASVNPLKYAEQVQKRKLLWSKNKKEIKPENEEPEIAKPASKTQWDGTLFSQDQDGKQTAKFRKLMGMKSGEGPSAGPASAEGTEKGEKGDDTNLRKQQELFSRLDQEYEFARMATHTHRGVGLGFSSMHHQYQNK